MPATGAMHCSAFPGSSALGRAQVIAQGLGKVPELRWLHRDWERSQNSGDCTAFIKLLHFSIYKTFLGFRRLGKAGVQGQPPCTALPFLAGSSALGRTQGDSTGTGKGPRGSLHSLVQKEITNRSKPVLLWHFWVPEGESLGKPELGGSEVGFTVLSAVTDHHFPLAWE